MVPNSIIESVATSIVNSIQNLQLDINNPNTYAKEVWKIVVKEILNKVDSMTINLSYSGEVNVNVTTPAGPGSGSTVGLPTAIQNIDTTNKTWS
jgi:hypothetical protein